jgi:hypothetical protein
MTATRAGIRWMKDRSSIGRRAVIGAMLLTAAAGCARATAPDAAARSGPGPATPPAPVMVSPSQIFNDVPEGP